MDEWRIADDCHAEDVNPGEVIRYRDSDGSDQAGEVVSVSENEDGDTVTIVLDADLDMERHEIILPWDAMVDILVRDYSGVEV